MPKFRKKPVEIEAVQWTGNRADVADVQWLNFVPGAIRMKSGGIEIKTLEGTMTANVGDWIIKGVQGELYPCKPDIFEATYDPID